MMSLEPSCFLVVVVVVVVVLVVVVVVVVVSTERTPFRQHYDTKHQFL